MKKRKKFLYSMEDLFHFHHTPWILPRLNQKAQFSRRDGNAFSILFFSVQKLGSQKLRFLFKRGKIHGVWIKGKSSSIQWRTYFTPWILPRLNKNKMEMPSQYFGFGNILPVPLPPHTHTVFPTLNFGMNKDQLPQSPPPLFGTCSWIVHFFVLAIIP